MVSSSLGSSEMQTASNQSDAGKPAASVTPAQSISAPYTLGVYDAGHPAANLALDALDDLKAEQIVTFDLRGRSNVCEFMVVASGRSNTHVGSLAENLNKRFKAEKSEVLSMAGTEQRDWVVFDANSVVVHIFRPEVRRFYQLEKMWDPSFELADPGAMGWDSGDGEADPDGELSDGPVLNHAPML